MSIIMENLEAAYKFMGGHSRKKYSAPVLHLSNEELTILPNMKELRELHLLEFGGANWFKKLKTVKFVSLRFKDILFNISLEEYTNTYEYRLVLDKVSVWYYTDTELYSYLEKSSDIEHTLLVQMGYGLYKVKFIADKKHVDSLLSVLSNIEK